MEIGRLEFYATKRDRNGSYFGKIYPYNEAMRDNYEDQLVFFHESRISSTSALRRDGKLRGYRYITHMLGRTVFNTPVFVAFEAPQSPKTSREASASAVMLLEEADPENLPYIDSISEPAVKLALVSAFPGFYTLSRIAIDLLRSQDEGSRLDLMKACWDGSGEDDIRVFMESLEPDEAGRVLSILMHIDKREDRSLTPPRRTRQALTARTDIALRGDIAEMLLPSMWIEGFLGYMESRVERREFLESAQPDFRAYAFTRFIESGGSLDADDTDDMAEAFRDCGNAKLRVECLATVLSREPGLALRADISTMLTTDMWVDEFLGIMTSPEDRRAFLGKAQKSFRAYALTQLLEAGRPLEDDVIEDLLSFAREGSDEDLASRCLLSLLTRSPDLALRADVSAMLTADTWVDGFLGLMANAEDRDALLAHAKPDFRAFALSKHIGSGGLLDDDVIEWLVSAIRECEDATPCIECMKAVLARKPSIALRADVSSVLTPGMWTDGLLDLLRDLAAQDAFLASAKPDIKAYAIGELVDAGAPLCDAVYTMCTLRSCPVLFDRIRWSSDDDAYAHTIGSWLEQACLFDYDDRKRIVSAAERMHATGQLLSPVMWGRLPVVMRIRLLIFWSNHYADLDDYSVRDSIRTQCIDAYRSSWRGYDPTLKAAMLLFALPFARDARKAFLDANDALVGEIVRQFNECEASEVRTFTLDAGMQALLQRCTSWPYVSYRDVSGFCDGRRWDKDDDTTSVWCHVGTDRPDDGRRECMSLRSPISADNTERKARTDLENQFLADMLANVNTAMGEGVRVGQWLDSGDMDLVEYAYRISGYVNKLALALPHMVCRGCGSRLGLNYKYPRENLYGEGSNRSLKLPALSATACSCLRKDDPNSWHDVDVYIHYCLSCHRVIDSRECRMRDRAGYYLCMYCGASKEYRPATACPSCGNTDARKLSYYTGSMRKEMHYQGMRLNTSEILVACKVCSYDARDFVSAFEE